VNVRVVCAEDVRRLMPVADCIDVMVAALSTLARGEATQPLRTLAWLPDKSGLLGMMPGHLSSPAAFGLKAVSYIPDNATRGLDSHQGVVMLFDPEDGRPLGIVDATSITAIRTAAVSGAATRALAREDARVLALLGTGVQAITHLDAVSAVRPLSRVNAWNPDPDRARAFASAQAERTGLDVVASPTAREAVSGADIVCTVTAATEPVLEGEWLSAGCHVNAVGACLPHARELDTAAVLASRLYVDRRESALAEAGDLLIPISEGACGADHIVAELGEVFLGHAPGRGTPEEITLFESLGLAVEDLAAARHVLTVAERDDAGAVVPLGELRQA